MFGGDEVNAIVVDIGSCTTKAGYAGEDTPKAVFPSWVGKVPGELREAPPASKDGEDTEMKEADERQGGEDTSKQGEAGDKRVKPKQKYYVGTSSLAFRRDDMEVVPAIKNGLYDDWDIIESLWDTAFNERLRLNPSHHPMMLAEPSNNERTKREKAVEMMFEIYSPPALFLGKNAALASFSSGRQTSLVMDCGYDATTVAAVHDGYVLQKSICRAPLGGATLNQCMQAAVEQGSSVEIRPRYAFTRKEGLTGVMEAVPLELPKTTESYKRYMKEVIASDIKETICRVHETTFDEEQNKNIPTVSYELPDGQEIQVGSDRFKVPEVMFQASLATSFKGVEALKADGGADASSLPQMVLESINKCDVDVRKELCSGVLLTGGSSLIPQLRERIERELAELISNVRVKVMTSPSSIERKFSVWIGGSILASLGSFQQMWMSKTDYQEHGASLIHRKAP
mmetsp:Transcript_34825/g.98733  ORF Transcript_34825/g.98733 Transcript_34825/m.98733 type:complete len:456 (-) Transcript_34825:223-1590(-)